MRLTTTGARMRPLFTSPSEWISAAVAGEKAYVRKGTGHVMRAGLLGFFVLAGPNGTTDSYWRSLPVLSVFAISLMAGAVPGALRFRREWRAALRTYGPPVGIGRRASANAIAGVKTSSLGRALQETDSRERSRRQDGGKDFNTEVTKTGVRPYFPILAGGSVVCRGR